MNLLFSLSRLPSRTCALLLHLPKVLGLSSKAKKKLTVFYDRLSRKGSSSTTQSTEEVLSSSSSSKEEHVGRLLKLSSVISKNTKSRGYYLKVAVSRLKIAWWMQSIIKYPCINHFSKDWIWKQSMHRSQNTWARQRWTASNLKSNWWWKSTD